VSPSRIGGNRVGYMPDGSTMIQEDRCTRPRERVWEGSDARSRDTHGTCNDDRV
jgi:hypothetical protein